MWFVLKHCIFLQRRGCLVTKREYTVTIPLLHSWKHTVTLFIRTYRGNFLLFGCVQCTVWRMQIQIRDGQWSDGNRLTEYYCQPARMLVTSWLCTVVETWTRFFHDKVFSLKLWISDTEITWLSWPFLHLMNTNFDVIFIKAKNHKALIQFLSLHTPKTKNYNSRWNLTLATLYKQSYRMLSTMK